MRVSRGVVGEGVGGVVILLIALFFVVNLQFSSIRSSRPAQSHPDCLARVWAYHADRMKGILESGDVPANGSPGSVELFEHGGIAWASEIRIQVLSDEVKKGSELGVPDAFGQLVGPLVDICEKGENLFGGQEA